MPIGPRHVKERRDADKQVTESLMKPNSASSKSTTTKETSKERRPDTLPTWRAPRPRDLSPLSRKTTNLSLLTEDMNNGLYERPDDAEPADIDQRPKSAGFVNPNLWKIPLKVCDPPYVTNLMDDYPRDEYTMMPQVESAPKYFDGRNGPRMYKKDIKERSIDTKKKLREPELPKEISSRIMSDDPTKKERPVLFKPRHIIDVQVKKKYGDDIVGRSEVSFHLCDDMSSFLCKNSLNKESDIFNVASASKPLSKEHRQLLEKNSILDSHPSTRSASSSNWTSVKFPREKVLQSIHKMSKPNAFPDLNGEEYSIGSGP